MTKTHSKTVHLVLFFHSDSLSSFPKNFVKRWHSQKQTFKSMDLPTIDFLLDSLGVVSLFVRSVGQLTTSAEAEGLVLSFLNQPEKNK